MTTRDVALNIRVSAAEKALLAEWAAQDGGISLADVVRRLIADRRERDERERDVDRAG